MDAGRGITRRALLQGATAAAAAVALGNLAACSPSGDPDRPGPNVLLVLADDMRADFLPFAQRIQARLGATGRTFSAARTNVSLCQPFRVGLLTGQWAKHHLMLDNGDTRIVPHDNTIGKWVQDAGYRTALIGKYLNGAPPQTPKPRGWTTWRQLLGDSDARSYNRHGYSVHDGTATAQPDTPQLDYLRDEVISFVAGAQPWFCVMTPTAPHYPFEPAPEDDDKWTDLEWETPEDVDMSDKPSWYSALPPLSRRAKAEFQAIARAQAREIAGLDRAVIEILDSLASSVVANTVVIFSSDDGLSYGEHRSPYTGASKNDFYDHNLLVPLVCNGPGFSPGTSTVPVSAEADITKTIVAVTGATAGLPGDGVELRDIQDEPAAHADRHLLHERAGGGSNNPNPASGLCVTNATRKLMRWTGRTGRDRYEAYDLDTDPNEFTNWAYEPARLPERDALEAQLDLLCPPPSLIPTLLYGDIDSSDSGSKVTGSITPAHRSVVMIDVCASRESADITDVVLTGDCIEKVVLLAADSQVGKDGLTRRLMSFEARGTGAAGAITVAAGAGQSLTGLGLTVTEYEYRSAVVQTLASGTATPTASFGASLAAAIQGPDNTAHFSILTDTDAEITGDDGATILYDAGRSSPAARFATLWVASETTPAASSQLPVGSWSAVASEIGT